MAAGTVQVRGLRELQRDFKKMSGGLSKDVDKELRGAAKIVSDEARSLSASHGFSQRSVTGLRPRTKGFGRAFVEQSRRKTTGKRGDFGAMQMQRVLLPALARKQDDVVKALDKMLARLGGEYDFY